MVEIEHIVPSIYKIPFTLSVISLSSENPRGTIVEKSKIKFETVDNHINDLIDRIKTENKHAGSKIDIQRVNHAINFAIDSHAGQHRKVTGEPYICHPLRVAKLVVHEGEECILLALLHDVVEDTTKTLQDIEAEFGETIYQNVDLATEREFKKRIPANAPQQEKESDWKMRKVRQIDRIPSMNKTVHLVETANALDNIRCMQEEYVRLGNQAFEKLTVGKAYQLWRYTALTTALKDYQGQNSETNPFLPKLEQEVNKWKIMVGA